MDSPRMAAFGGRQTQGEISRATNWQGVRKGENSRHVEWEAGLGSEALESRDVYSGVRRGGGNKGGSVQGRRGTGIPGMIKASNCAPSIGASLGDPC